MGEAAEEGVGGDRKVVVGNWEVVYDSFIKQNI